MKVQVLEPLLKKENIVRTAQQLEDKVHTYLKRDAILPALQLPKSAERYEFFNPATCIATPQKAQTVGQTLNFYW